MKFAIAAAVATAFSLAAAQSTSSLPDCSKSCITNATSGDSIGGCNNFDVSCICSNSQFLNNIACCLKQECQSADQDTAVDYAKQFCSTVGVDVPDRITCNGTTALGNSSSDGDDSDSDDSGAIGVAPAFIGVLAGVVAAALALV